MEIQIDQVKDAFVLRLDGKLDAATASFLESKIEPLLDKKQPIFLDFSKVDYLSSAGMRLLLSLTKKLGGQKQAFGLFAVTDDVMQIIKVAGFDKILTIYPNEKAALESF